MNGVPNRNDPCPCGSGKKYKRCCLGQSSTRTVAGEDVDQYVQSAVLHHQAGRLQQAEAVCRQALQLEPNHPDALYLLGVLNHQVGKAEAAIDLIGRAIRGNPANPFFHDYLGLLYRTLNRLSEAEAVYRRALEIDSDSAEAHYNLGVILQELERPSEAEARYRHALVLRPDFAGAHYNLSIVLKCQGRLVEAEASFLRALDFQPDHADAHSNLLFLYGYHFLVDPDEYLAQARNWERACLSAQDRQAARHRVFERSSLARRRLRVGYVSGDYRQHAVSYFIEPLFACHDRARIELFAYSTHGQCDAITKRLRSLAEHWVPLAGVGDAAILERIESDGIDVLIDLSGHTDHNRLRAFARRAAPVQAHYLGYFASTGLTEMDYWIGDDMLTPAGTESHFSERVWRLPRTWVCYDGKADAPIPDWRPGEDGTVWLGSFNNLGKLTPASLALWAKVLHALPEGKLRLKTKELGDMRNRQRILDTMAGQGISPDRMELLDRSATPDWYTHMANYDRLDLALDPVGAAGGGTTTCDALWMGVPVIAREGDRMASRMTVSMLDAIGRPEWIARSDAQYIDKIVSLARDVERRKALRFSQRDRMAASPLCDPRGLARSLEDAYFGMFERWFAGSVGKTRATT